MKRPGTEWNERVSPRLNARRRLPHMMSEYFDEVRDALAEKPSPASLHRIRLASKKVRYTLELFRPCYAAAAFEARLWALKDVQTSLGEVNDAVATSRLIGKLMPHSPARGALREFLKTRADEKAAEFRLHWTEQFDAPGQERWWTGFLGGRNGTASRAAVRLGKSGGKPSKQAGS